MEGKCRMKIRGGKNERSEIREREGEGEGGRRLKCINTH